MHVTTRRSILIGVVLTAASCSKKDGPTGPSGPDFASYAGTWSGTTSQSRNMSLWVGPNGTIDSIRVQIRIDLLPGLSSCLVTFTPKAISIGNDLEFTTPLSLGSFEGTLAGTFTSAAVANGTFQAGWESSAVCGSSIVFGSGGQEENGTWTATK